MCRRVGRHRRHRKSTPRRCPRRRPGRSRSAGGVPPASCWRGHPGGATGSRRPRRAPGSIRRAKGRRPRGRWHRQGRPVRRVPTPPRWGDHVPPIPRRRARRRTRCARRGDPPVRPGRTPDPPGDASKRRARTTTSAPDRPAGPDPAARGRRAIPARAAPRRVRRSGLRPAAVRRRSRSRSPPRTRRIARSSPVPRPSRIPPP